ncbi:MAG: hypothetical protein HGB26_04075 [Desulfobulbaceae bacterium]|nr:hypothetical protein [Desulfobulbaceae bacterium]
MKYILDKLQAQEDIANILQDTNNLRLTKQIKVEASLLGILGYLWGLHYTGLNSDHQCDAVQLSRKPTIGQIVQLIRTLDTQNSISRKVRAVIERYPNLRNEFLGHGYLYTSSISSFSDDMDAIYDAFMTSGIPIFQHNCSLVLVLAKDGSVYKGIRFSPGINLAPWMISSGEFVCGDTYFLVEDRYVRSSPFLSLSKDGEAYIFNRIEDALTGAIKTMNVLTGAQSRLYEQQFTAGQVQIGFNRFKSPNGTVYNAFQANFKAYIPVNNIKALILKFARGNNAACATVWGHGGMGKTAAVQEAILELRNKDHKVFDYIVFVSAKDRLYDYEAANIITTQPTCRTLEDMQVIMREVLFADPTAGDDIIDTNFLLVVDDFETFCAEERHKIVSFIRTFNATKNKAIITTRANIIIGEEIPTNELDQEQTERFLYDYMRTVFPDYPILQQEIKDVGEALIRSSGGRPLFILQIAHLVPQIGLSAAAGRLITSGDSAKKFLFDRIYDSYLSTQLSRDVYCVISRLVGGAELRNMISKVAFLLNLEANMEVVQKSFDELAKIRVIKLDEDGRFFEVYSIELIEFMRAQYDLRESVFKRTCESRLKLIASSSEKDVDSALLEQANSKRLFGSQKEVTDAYRMLLNRPNCSTKIRRDALLNLVAYLVTIKGNRAEGIRIIREYVEIFKDDSLYVKMYATYLWQESGEGDRQEALEMLRRYVALGRDLSSTLDLEIVGMFMTFWSNDFLAQWQECKDTRYSKPSEDYQRERQALLYEGNQIYLLSNRIFPLIEHKDLLRCRQVRVRIWQRASIALLM